MRFQNQTKKHKYRTTPKWKFAISYSAEFQLISNSPVWYNIKLKTVTAIIDLLDFGKRLKNCLGQIQYLVSKCVKKYIYLTKKLYLLGVC